MFTKVFYFLNKELLFNLLSISLTVFDPQLRREEQELSKIETGMAQVFLKEVKEREKMRQWKKQNLDPRNASR